MTICESPGTLRAAADARECEVGGARGKRAMHEKYDADQKMGRRTLEGCGAGHRAMYRVAGQAEMGEPSGAARGAVEGGP